ncbi:MAG: DUF1800 domain-containing protein, partial [Terrimicrobiaceae bacterium]|nr:DUF1800 domain-containing protein [Terrimicrobiaceae bacterium]
RQELRRAEGAALLDLKAWWITRLRYSPCPVRETMTLFWHGHFATSFEKVQSAEAMLRQNHLFRDLGMGRFEDLTLAVSRDAAMMRYLDLAGSSKKQPNENFARELLELFTLGEGNYTEADVREVARAFTGWRIEPANGAIRFDPSRFDGGPKTVLGETGPLGAPECVRVICRHPQCARFLTAKLWEFFAGGPPPPEVAKKLAEVFRATGGSLRQVLEAVFRAPEFYGADVCGRRIKSPAEWLGGTLKSLNLPPPPAAQTAAALRELGQNLFAPPNVKGWEGGKAWISATTLLARQRLALDLFLPVPPSLVPEEARQSPERLAAHAAGVLMPAGIPEQVVKAACSALASEPFPATSTTCTASAA